MVAKKKKNDTSSQRAENKRLNASRPPYKAPPVAELGMGYVQKIVALSNVRKAEKSYYQKQNQRASSMAAGPREKGVVKSSDPRENNTLRTKTGIDAQYIGRVVYEAKQRKAKKSGRK